MFRRFLSYYKPHKLTFTLDMLASLFMSLIAILYPVMTKELVSQFTDGEADIKLVVILGVALFLLYVVRSGLNWFVCYIGHMMGVKMQMSMRSDLFSHLETLPFSYFDNNETGAIMSRITNDLFEISELAHHGPENLLISSILIIISFVYLATINLALTLIIFVCLPVLIYIAIKTRKRMSDAFSESRKTLSGINAAVESSISGVRVTKAFNNSEIEKEKFEKTNEAFGNARKKAYRALSLFSSSTQFVTNVFNVVVLVAGGIFLINGSIDLADYTAYIASVSLFITPVNALTNFMEQFEEGASGFRRVCEILDEKPENEPENPITIGRAEGRVTFENVSFNYNETKEVLDGVSFDIKKGQTHALVGPSGGGKTTICHLIPRFYIPTEGRILIDGVDISTLSLASLRANIGIVQQDIYLFNASFKDNILYGRPDATDEDVVEAAKLANIHDYIVSLPEGYDTVVGERGVKLSGGQKQRISIARVFLKNPPILILDEATSALDNATEIMIREALTELSKGRTTIVVAHRLSTVTSADEISVIENGKIIENGTHKELIQKGGMYATLCRQQYEGMNMDI